MANENKNINEEVFDETASEEINQTAENSAEEKPLTEKELLEKQISELTAQSQEYKDKWYRTAAEFENFKKRNNETRKNAYEDGKIDTIKKILFIGDNLERALTYSMDEKTTEGLQMLLRQYGEIMTNLGLEEINPVGEKFDPTYSEAIFSKDAEEGQESQTVDSVFLKGYKSGDRVIRYAQVVVIK